MRERTAVTYWLLLSIGTLMFGIFGSSIASEPEAAAESDREAAETIYGLMPRQETGALDFLQEHPEYDGNGVVVAIFDTGVDPGVVGLQTTPDGRPKVIDIVDATGSGDVDMSKVVTPENGKVTGLSGRVLKLDPKWKMSDSEVRVGMKAGYELYPHELVDRVKDHRRKEFMQKQRQLENDLRSQLEDFKKDESKVDKAELEKRLEALVAAGKSYTDPGPLYDCVVFNDGEHFRAAVDTDEDGDLADEKAMTNYRVAREYAQFDEVSLLNFGVNIYEGGKVLSIVADAHPHGTHVAGIVAGYYPDQPEWNGVAPGAQIVSCKIGDTYIDGMETGQALIRATKTVLENKCDLVNMSFGEPTKAPNKGLIIRYFDELVTKHGVIFCASAGNSGPALSTVGAPGGTSSSLIGIGAHVSPKMMEAQYALRETFSDRPYTWSSRGPTFDGDIGVNLFAPGGAFAPVPQWTLQKSMQMNGTSMASPNCCGNFALVLSGLKSEKVEYNPESVRRAFENTAQWIDDASPWAQGAGLIQTPLAFDALKRDAGRNAELYRLEVTLSNGNRGVYLREPHEAGDDAQPQEYRVTVKPLFHPNATSQQKVDFRIRLDLQSTEDWVQVGPESTLSSEGDMISVFVDPTSLDAGAHYAEVQGIDPQHPERGPLFRLPVTVIRLIRSYDYEFDLAGGVGGGVGSGGFPFGSTSKHDNSEGLDSKESDPLSLVELIEKEVDQWESLSAVERCKSSIEFDETLTLVINGRSMSGPPTPDMYAGWLKESPICSKPGSILRRFIAVPAGATWVDLRFHMEPHDNGGRSRMFMVHALQAIAGLTNRDGEKNNFVVLEPEIPKVISFPVQPGRTMELAIAQYWSSLGRCNLHYELTFHGLTPDQREVRLQPGDQAVRVEVSTPLQYEKLAPSAKLTKVRRLVKPTSAKITQLAEDRDGFDEDRRFHLLELSYPIEQKSGGSVTPRFPKTGDLLYDSEYGGHLWAIFENDGRRVATDDIWPDAVSLGKGSYTLKLWLRHDSRAKLESLKSATMSLDRPLGSPVSLSVYSTLIDAMQGGAKFRSKWLAPGQKQRLFVANVSSGQGGTLAGDILLGTITYGEEGTHDGAGQLPGGFPVSVVVSTAHAVSASSGGASRKSSAESFDEPLTDAAAKNPRAKLNRKLREARLEFLNSLSIASDRAAFDRMVEDALKKDESDLTVLVAKLRKLDDKKTRKERLSEVVEAADAVLAQLDEAAIAMALVGRLDANDKEAGKARKSAEKKKSLLIDTLYRKGRALGYMELPEVLAKNPIKDKKAHNKAFEDAYKALSKWVDPTGSDYFLLHIRREARKQHLGESLKWLNKYSGDAAPNYWYLEKRRKIYEALGWDHLTENAWQLRTSHFPNGKP
jgi:subtilisin family serine protease